MRLCLISSEDGRSGELDRSVQNLARLLAGEHEVTVVHAGETSNPEIGADDPPSLRQVKADRSRLPLTAFSCTDHLRSAAALLAIEDAYGDEPPDYLEVPDCLGHGLVPMQAWNAGHRSLRGSAVAVRLHGMAEPICLHDGTWSEARNRIVFDLEREVLRLADVVVWPGGDVPALYNHYLGWEIPGAWQRLRLPLEQPPRPSQAEARDAGRPLRLLYAGSLQRVKGVLPLVEACSGVENGDWRLTMIGPDTETAPLGWSMRETIETMCAGEERVSLLGPVPFEELWPIFDQHDLLVVPSQFEVWPSVVLGAMQAGLPILATPVGGLTEIVEDGVTGWHLPDASCAAIRHALEDLLANRAKLEKVRASGEVFRRVQRLTDPGTVLAGYNELLSGLRSRRPRRRGRTGSSEPLVTGVVPYFGEHEWVGDAVRSLLGQTHRNLEVTIVNDGSLEPEDAVLDELAKEARVRVLTKLNGGDHTSRNLGILDADGKYVAMLDADNVFEPEFVERAVAMLVADPDLAYVTSWLRFVGEPSALAAIATPIYPPLGNAVRSDDRINSDGDSMAVLPRSLFTELGYRYEESGITVDWELYRTLRDDGRYGAVIPELLGRYRVRGESISRAFTREVHDRAHREGLSRRRLRRL